MPSPKLHSTPLKRYQDYSNSSMMSPIKLIPLQSGAVVKEW